MLKRSVFIGLVALMVLSLVVSVVMAAEEDKKPARGDRAGRTRAAGERGQRGQGGMADFQKRIMGMYKENLGASDAEWKIIEPKLTKVTELSRESRSSGMRGMMGRGGRGGDTRGGRGGDTRGARGGDTRGGRGGDRGERTPREGDRPENAIQKASTALATVLENKSSTNDQIKAKLLGLRKAKEQAEQKLAAAQKDLKSVLTVRQEAKLVAAGILN